jgi:Uma2 family endonuclease
MAKLAEGRYKSRRCPKIITHAQEGKDVGMREWMPYPCLAIEALITVDQDQRVDSKLAYEPGWSLQGEVDQCGRLAGLL